MVEEIRHPDGRIEHPTVRYERTDASFPWIFSIIIAAAIFGVLIYIAIWGFLRSERAELAEQRRSRYPIAPKPSTALPPEPRLEQLDRLKGIEIPNVYVRQQVKENRLARYGPTEEEGFVHIPIKQAMHLLATIRKLPVRNEKAAALPRDNWLVDGGESNSGRLFDRRRPRWLAR
ncbi:MAG: hypothetical protein IT429_06375 [Gemmataceae bacterium]|nr:hypothetical protein [Gemmataceae bacterium]